MRSSEEDLRRAFEKWHQRIIDNIAEALLYVCTEAVNRARATDTYKDRTNNLRSSIGFVIYYNGQRLFQDFQKSESGTAGGGDSSGQHGQSQGAALAGWGSPDKTLSGAIKGITEEIAGVLAGQVNAMRIQKVEQTETLRQQLAALHTIAANTGYNKHLASIDRKLDVLQADPLRASGLNG